MRQWIGVRAAVTAGVACAAVLMAGQEGFASPIVLSFESITNNSTESSDIAEAQMSVEISDGGANNVLFKFFNTGPDAATITAIYFDDDVPVLDVNGVHISDSEDLTDSDAIQFSDIGTTSPTHLPGGNDPAIVFTSTYDADANNPAPHNGVNPGEWVSFLFNFVDGIAFANLASAINSGDFRMGLHVTAFDNNQSEGLVNTPPGSNPVPEPASMLLMGLGALGLGGFARYRNRSKESAAA